MTPELEVALVLGAFLGLLALGLNIPLAIAIPAIAYLLIDGGWSALNSIGFLAWGSLNNAALTAVPLFIFMAEILGASGLSDKVYRGMDRLVGRLPGGLLQTNIAGCAIFSSVCGSSIATAAAIGRIALPQLNARKYSPALSAGSLAAGGTLGILIPPSIALIIYSTFTDTSVPRLFMAALVPGLILAGLFMLYIAVHSFLFPVHAETVEEKRSAREYLDALMDIMPFAILVGGTLGSLYTGIATTTEAATIGCILATLLGVTRGNLTYSGFMGALQSAVWLSGNILFIVLAAFIFSSATSFAGINQIIMEFITNLELTKIEFFIVVFALFIVMGTLVESIGMLVITVPILYPLLAHFNIDPILFGVITVLFIEMAQITPPMGINLFVVHGMWDGKLVDVMLGALPFSMLILLMAILLVVAPDLALWLPDRLY